MCERSAQAKEGGGCPASTSTRLEAAAGVSSAAAEAAATKLRFLRETCHQSNQDNIIVVHSLRTQSFNSFISNQSNNQLIILDNSSEPYRKPLETIPVEQWHFHKFLEDRREK